MLTNSTSSNEILFLDIDGPMIPYRCVYLPDQTRIMTKFDPVAVAMINDLCENRGIKIVIHSSWINILGQKETLQHCINQGIKEEYFYTEPYCLDIFDWRYNRVAEWLSRHPEVSNYVILDDTEYEPDKDGFKHPVSMSDRLVLIDYYDGLTFTKLREMIDVLDGVFDEDN